MVLRQFHRHHLSDPLQQSPTLALLLKLLHTTFISRNHLRKAYNSVVPFTIPKNLLNIVCRCLLAIVLKIGIPPATLASRNINHNDVFGLNATNSHSPCCASKSLLAVAQYVCLFLKSFHDIGFSWFNGSPINSTTI